MQCRLHYWMHKQLHMHMKEQHVIAMIDIARNIFGCSSVQASANMQIQAKNQRWPTPMC